MEPAVEHLSLSLFCRPFVAEVWNTLQFFALIFLPNAHFFRPCPLVDALAVDGSLTGSSRALFRFFDRAALVLSDSLSSSYHGGCGSRGSLAIPFILQFAYHHRHRWRCHRLLQVLNGVCLCALWRTVTLFISFLCSCTYSVASAGSCLSLVISWFLLRFSGFPVKHTKHDPCVRNSVWMEWAGVSDGLL